MTDEQRVEFRVSVRVEPSLYSALQRVADERYEGRWSMAAREAFRRFVEEIEEEAA